MASELTIKDIRNILTRRKWTIIITSLISLAILLSIVFFSKPEPVYEAVAAIKIGKIVSEVAEILLGSSSSSFADINTAPSMIKSFQVLEALAKKFKLLPDKIKKENILSSPKYMAVIKDLENKITVEKDKTSSDILIINVKWPDPIIAKNIANSMAEIYEKIDFYERNRAIIESKKAIKEKLKQEEKELNQKRERLRNYKLNLNLGDINNDTQVIVDSIVEKQRKIDDTRKNIPLMDDKINLLTDQLNKGRYVGWVDNKETGDIVSKLNDTLKDLKLKELTLLIDYNPEHPEVEAVREQMKAVVKQMIEDLEAQKVRSYKDLNFFNTEMLEYRSQLKGIPDRAKEFAILERDVKTSEELYDKLAMNYQEINIKESGMVPNVQLVRYAFEPKEPINQVATSGNFILSIFLSIIFGFIGGMIKEALDTIPHRPEEIAEIFGVPLLATISHWNEYDYLGAVKKKYDNLSVEEQKRYISLSSHFLSESQIAEEYRSIVPNLLMQFKEKGLKVFIVLNAISGEGSSVFASNLAISLSQTGRTAILMEVDFRSPSVHTLFGIGNSPGLKDILLGNYKLELAIKKVTDLILGEINPEDLLSLPGLDNFYILTSGGTVENPSKYLNSINMEGTIKKLREVFDFVIITAPPALLYSEAFIMVDKADATILLSENEKLPRKILQNFRSQLETLKVKILGLVVNKVKKV